MTRKQIEMDKINKAMVIDAVRKVADELFKLDELLEGMEIAPEWLNQGYPFDDDISELPWMVVEWADELEDNK